MMELMLSTILVCQNCGDRIGSLAADEARELGARGKAERAVEVSCPGKGRHAPPTTTRRRAFFGLLEVVTTAFPETMTRAVRFDYVGPRQPFLLTLAIVFGGRRRRDGDYEPVYVDENPCTFGWHGGLAGPGAAGVKRGRSAPARANDDSRAAREAA
jgi:hypothetical protein